MQFLGNTAACCGVSPVPWDKCGTRKWQRGRTSGVGRPAIWTRRRSPLLYLGDAVGTVPHSISAIQSPPGLVTIARAPESTHPLNMPHLTCLVPSAPQPLAGTHSHRACTHSAPTVTLIRGAANTFGAQCTRSAPPSYPTCCSKRVPSATSLSHSRGHTGVYGRERR